MRSTTLHPVRTNEWRNHWLAWPRSKQVLASMLLWASRAEATRITFNPNRTEPLIYSNTSSSSIESELPPPPENVVDNFIDYLRDIAAGDTMFGLIRPRRGADGIDEMSLLINVPDIEKTTTHHWVMTVDHSSATFISKPD